MRIAFLYYDGFAEFEMVFTCLILHKHDLLFTALEDKTYQSEEKQKFLIDKVITDIDIDSIDAFIIPGGDPSPLFDNQTLKKFLEDLKSKNRIIAGICGGAVLLAQLGFLDHVRCTGNTRGILADDPDIVHFQKARIVNENVVVDGKIVTGQGQAFAEFAAEIARQLGVYETEEEYEEDVKWMKNIRG